MKTNKLLLSLIICVFLLGTSNAFALEPETLAEAMPEELSTYEELTEDANVSTIEDTKEDDISENKEDLQPLEDDIFENEEELQLLEDENDFTPADETDTTENGVINEIDQDNTDDEINTDNNEETPEPAAAEDGEQEKSSSVQPEQASANISSKPFTINSKKTSASASNDDYTSLEFTFSRENESEYYGFITGIKVIDKVKFQENLDTFISNIASFFYYNLDTYTPDDIQQKLTLSNKDDYGIDFIDAEKWTLSEKTIPESDSTDSLLCWAGTLSNMIELSDWADVIKDENGNPIINQTDNIPDEDEVFDLYRNSFYNGTVDILEGGQWFCDGVYQNQPVNDEGDAYTPHIEDNASVRNLSCGGYLKEYSSANIVTEYRTDSSADAADKIADMFSELNTGSVFGINQVVYNTEYKEYLNAHATTLMGYIKEMVNGIVGSGVEALKAIFVADSDNSAPTTGSRNPTEDENSITMINTVPVIVNGTEAIRQTTNMNPAVKYIFSVTRMCAQSSTEAENSKETDERATKDCIQNMDFCVTSMSSITEDPTYEIGSTITFSVHMVNKSYKKADIESGPRILKGSFIVYKDGMEYEKISTQDPFYKIYALEDMLDMYVDYTIKEYGNYEIGFVLESVCDGYTQQEVIEAYYLNNKSASGMNIKFVVKGEDEDKDKDEDEKNPDVNTNLNYFVPVYYYCFSLTTPDDTFTVNIGKLDMSGISVYYNGKLIEAEYYTISKDDLGNTNIIFNTDYLKSLGIGTHNFDLKSSNNVLIATVRISGN